MDIRHALLTEPRKEDKDHYMVSNQVQESASLTSTIWSATKYKNLHPLHQLHGQQPSTRICTLYIKGVGEQIRKISSSQGIQVTFHSWRTLTTMLMKVKPTRPDTDIKGVVYSNNSAWSGMIYCTGIVRPLLFNISYHINSIFYTTSCSVLYIYRTPVLCVAWWRIAKTLWNVA